jgi:TetR/AcrR family transcriptional regulator, regulator of cefoperazone and chloramphenicol sensitivity
MGFKPAISDEASQAATREHLLEAAADVFAEVGFRAATVREICQRARANIAAVNYHFGDKEQLYRTVLQETYRAAIAKYPADLGLAPRATPEERLRAFVYAFLMRIFSEGPSARHGKLMAREMIEPTGALDEIVKANIRPMADLLGSILRDLIGRKVDDETLRLCAMSVVSQVLFYHHCRPVVTRMFPDMKFNATAIEKLTAHITRFSLAAIKEIPVKSLKTPKKS